MTTLMLIVLGSSNAIASGGDPVTIPWDSLGLHALNLAILLGLMTWLLRGKIKDALANRAGSIKKKIDDSNTMRKDAKHRFEDLETRMTGFEKELEGMRSDAEIEADREKESILSQAEKDATRVQESAQRTIRDETDRARASLRREAAKLSIDLARERLKSEMNDEDQARLSADFLDTVKSDGGVTNG